LLRGFWAEISFVEAAGGKSGRKIGQADGRDDSIVIAGRRRGNSRQITVGVAVHDLCCAGYCLTDKLRIWGSGVRISSGAPTLSHYRAKNVGLYGVCKEASAPAILENPKLSALLASAL
jgi:hypothetical protein